MIFRLTVQLKITYPTLLYIGYSFYYPPSPYTYGNESMKDM